MTDKLQLPKTEKQGPHARIEKSLQLYLTKEGARLSPSGSTFDMRDGGHLSAKQVADVVWMYDGGAASQRMYQVMMDEMCRRLVGDRTARAKGRVLDVPANDGTELAKFVKLIAHLDTDADTMQYYITSFRQLLWQVKRRMRGLQSVWDIMLVLHSKQGTGKSSAVRKLGRVLDCLYVPTADFRLFSDPFSLQQLSSNYLICFDEMGRAKQTDINTIKQVITSDIVRGRGIYSDSVKHLPRNASFIATTNYPLTESVSDASGMRRFVEIRCRDEVWTQAYGDQMNAIDFEAVWAAETGEDQTTAPQAAEAARERSERHQEKLVVKDNFDAFLEECVEKGEEDDRMQHQTLYESYASHCRLQSVKPISSLALAARMQGVCQSIKPGNRRTYLGIRLIDTSAIE